MKPQDYIIRQLIEQQIEFEIIHDKSKEPSEPELNKVVFAWKNKLIGNKKAPYIDHFLWHIFSYRVAECLEKEAAVIELKKQFPTDIYIFNEQFQFLIKCKGKIPIIEMDDLFGDVYISHHNMKWTFVTTHELDLGPYFSTGT